MAIAPKMMEEAGFQTGLDAGFETGLVRTSSNLSAKADQDLAPSLPLSLDREQ